MPPWPSNENVSIRVSEYDTRNNVCEKLFGVKLGNELNFENHIRVFAVKLVRKSISLPE